MTKKYNYKYNYNTRKNNKSAFVSPMMSFKTKGSSFKATKQLAKAILLDRAARAGEQSLLYAAQRCQNKIFDMAEGIHINNKKTIGSIYNGHGSLFATSSNNVTYSVKNTAQQVLLGEATSSIHRTSLHVGKPTTKRLKSKASQLVLSEKLIKDSNRDYKTVKKRSSLTSTFGFNQRLHSFLLEDLYTTVEDMRILYKNKWKDYQKNFADKGINKTLYGDFLSESLKLTVKSESDHYSTLVKIHLIKIHDTDIDTHMVAKACFPTSKTNIIDALPTDMRYGKLTKNGKFNCTALTDLKCTLNKSTYFKSNCTIAKTFQRVLGPSDVWKFNYDLEYGPGIILNELFQTKNEKHPIGYAFVVDIQGDPRASITDRNGLNYDGTSPGRVNFSFERTIRLIKEQDWSNSGELFTVSQFEDQSNEFENEEFSQYFNSDREEKMNISFEDINIVRGVNQENVEYNLRYSEGRIPTYKSNQFPNIVDLDEIPADNIQKNSTETEIEEEDISEILENYVGDEEE